MKKRQIRHLYSRKVSSRAWKNRRIAIRIAASNIVFLIGPIIVASLFIHAGGLPESKLSFAIAMVIAMFTSIISMALKHSADEVERGNI